MLSVPVLFSCYPIAYNYCLKLFVDAVTAKESFSYKDIMLPVGLFLGIEFLAHLTWRIKDITEWHSEPFVKRSILLDSYDYVQNHSYKFFQHNFAGAITSKIKSILSGYEDFWVEIYNGLPLGILKIIVNLSALAFVNSTLGLYVFAATAVYMAAVWSLSAEFQRLSFEESNSQHQVLGQIADKITNINAIIGHATKAYEKKSLDEQITNDLVPKQIRRSKYYFKLQVVSSTLNFGMFALILFVTLHLKQKGAITLGDLAAVFNLSLTLSFDVWRTMMDAQDFTREVGDIWSAVSILEAKHEEKDCPDAKDLDTSDTKITFDNISFSHQEGKKLFDKLSLVIEKGEKVGLVGESGSGKSTLINLLLRYFGVHEGDIKIGNQSIYSVTQASLRKAVATIPQDVVLFHRSIMDNIRYGRMDASNEEVIEASRRAHIDEFINSLPMKYESSAGERGSKLSGGQKQRISIARVMLKDSPILILDEATSALDSKTERLIQDSLNYLFSRPDKTVIAIAHRLSTLQHMDRIIVMDAGKIVAQGTHEELIQKGQGIYKELWTLQRGI
jgi:ATP-binding cassette, subfamily B, bacterial